MNYLAETKLSLINLLTARVMVDMMNRSMKISAEFLVPVRYTNEVIKLIREKCREKKKNVNMLPVKTHYLFAFCNVTCSACASI